MNICFENSKLVIKDIGCGINIDTAYDESLKDEPFMRIFDGDSYDTSKNRQRISLTNPRYIDNGWSLTDDQLKCLNSVMHSGKKFNSPWYNIIMEASREFMIHNPNENKDFFSIRESTIPDFSKIGDNIDE